MHTFTTIILSTTLLLSSTLYAEDGEGKELFNDAKCMECHNKEDFKINKKKVANYKKLQNSVNACAVNTDAAWFDDETEEVVHYLNKKYYNFKAPQKKEE